METVMANCPHVTSAAQTGGVLPSGSRGFDAANGPPVKLIVFPGEIVPPDGVVAAIAALENAHATNSRSILNLVDVINYLLVFCPDGCGSTTTGSARTQISRLEEVNRWNVRMLGS